MQLRCTYCMRIAHASGHCSYVIGMRDGVLRMAWANGRLGSRPPVRIVRKGVTGASGGGGKSNSLPAHDWDEWSVWLVLARSSLQAPRGPVTGGFRSFQSCGCCTPSSISQLCLSSETRQGIELERTTLSVCAAMPRATSKGPCQYFHVNSTCTHHPGRRSPGYVSRFVGC